VLNPSFPEPDTRFFLLFSTPETRFFSTNKLEMAGVSRIGSDSGLLLSDHILFLKNDVRILSESCFG